MAAGASKSRVSKAPSARLAREARAERVSADPRWARLVARDPKADGRFLYSVETTGVYCRPSCAARTPRPEHVAFHASSAAAEKAGFRACKRCRPGQASLAQEHARLVADLCRFIDAAPQPPRLEELAARAQCSVYHLHRVFKAVTGLTPRAYAAGQRAGRVRSELGRARSVTEAVFDAGFNSGSRFYEQAERMLGMTPSAYRNGAAQLVIRFALGECSLGAILVATSAQGVCAILLGNDPAVLVRDLQSRFDRAELVPGDAEFATLVARVVAFVEAPRIGLDLPLDLRGTLFQERVWQALRTIPAGETASYAELAARIGNPKAIRAVASACAANPLAVAVPCHRVLRSDGALSGYRWGVARKRELLKRERG